MFNLVLYSLAAISLGTGFFASLSISSSAAIVVIASSIILALVLISLAIWYEKRQVVRAVWGNLS